jgi:ribosomal protein S18 acetylase RimI-like enzyme
MSIPTDFQLRFLQKNDLPLVSGVHLDAFPAGALTSLGIEAVSRYYRWQLLGPHDVDALGLWQAEQLAGFCFGGLFRGASSGFINKNRSFLAWRVLTHPWLLGNELFRDRFWAGLKILRGLIQLKRKSPSIPMGSSRLSYGILAIAVSPRFHRCGVGKRLMDFAEQQAISKGFSHMHLTVHASNIQAISFYESLAWTKDMNGEQWNGRMIKMLGS